MVRRFTFAAFVALGAVAVAVPASAGPGGPGVPDAKIAKAKAGPYKGNNVYDELGAGQTLRKRAHRGDVKQFFFKVENDGAGAEELNFDATFDSADAFKYRYFRGDTDITNQIEGTATHGIELDAGEQASFRVRLKIKNNAPKEVHDGRAGLGDVSDEDIDAVQYKVKVV